MTSTRYTPTVETKQYAAEMVNVDENIKDIEECCRVMGCCRKATAIQVARLKAANELLRQAAAMLSGESPVAY